MTHVNMVSGFNVNVYTSDFDEEIDHWAQVKETISQGSHNVLAKRGA